MFHHGTKVGISLAWQSAGGLVEMGKAIGLSVPANQISLSS